VGRKNLLLCGGLLGLLQVGGELPPPLLIRGRLPMPVGARLLLLLLQQPADVGKLVVLLLLLFLLLLLVAVVLRLVGGRLLLSVVACAWPYLGVLVFLVLLRRVQLLMMLHVLVLVGDRRLMFLLGNNVLLVMYGGLQLGVLLLLLIVPLLLVVGVLHVGSLRLLVVFCGWLLQHLLVDIETLLVRRLVTLLFVLS
jgi:hypothetical protein